MYRHQSEYINKFDHLAVALSWQFMTIRRTVASSENGVSWHDMQPFFHLRIQINLNVSRIELEETLSVVVSKCQVRDGCTRFSELVRIITWPSRTCGIFVGAFSDLPPKE